MCAHFGELVEGRGGAEHERAFGRRRRRVQVRFPEPNPSLRRGGALVATPTSTQGKCSVRALNRLQSRISPKSLSVLPEGRSTDHNQFQIQTSYVFHLIQSHTTSTEREQKYIFLQNTERAIRYQPTVTVQQRQNVDIFY